MFTVAEVGLLGLDGSMHRGLIFAGARVELDGDGVVVFDEGFDGVPSSDLMHFLRYINCKDWKWLSGMEGASYSNRFCILGASYLRFLL